MINTVLFRYFSLNAAVGVSGESGGHIYNTWDVTVPCTQWPWPQGNRSLPYSAQLQTSLNTLPLMQNAASIILPPSHQDRHLRREAGSTQRKKRRSETTKWYLHRTDFGLTALPLEASFYCYSNSVTLQKCCAPWPLTWSREESRAEAYMQRSDSPGHKGCLWERETAKAHHTVTIRPRFLWNHPLHLRLGGESVKWITSEMINMQLKSHRSQLAHAHLPHLKRVLLFPIRLYLLSLHQHFPPTHH